MWWKSLLFIGISVMIVFSYVTPAPNQLIGESSRILYYHVPQAWIAVLAFAMSMVFSIRYLKHRVIIEDDRALVAARLGFLFCLLATITGSIFAKVTWLSFWNWDPRETSIFILLLIYGAYFALRGALEAEERRATLAAVYSIFAFLTVPFLIFVLPRLQASLHPTDAIVDANLEFTMGPEVKLVFFSSLVLFTAVFLWMYFLCIRVQTLLRKRFEET
ncbi:MAG: cytochrome c biogenesis protein CcsA [Candidatus Zixiibacteriota bacterium]|nr:MAG: cytochrome c biogenesis protein CcsA [candidate division Zixibacteria bacterium]